MWVEVTYGTERIKVEIDEAYVAGIVEGIATIMVRLRRNSQKA